MRLSRVVHYFLSFFACISNVWASGLTVGVASQCAPFTISWSDAVPPVVIMLAPVLGTPRIYSPPSWYTNGNNNSFSLEELPFEGGTKLIVVVSDPRGFAMGGTSSLLTVEAPANGTSCDTTALPSFYTYNLTSSRQQCAPFLFDGYDEAVMPVTFMALIPGGQSFLLQNNVATPSYTWVANVSVGTSMIFTMLDHDNRTGVCSDLETILPSSDASCLNTSSVISAGTVQSTVVAPSASASASASAPASASASASASAYATPANSGSVPISSVIAGVSTGLVAGVVVAIIWFRFFRKKAKRMDHDINLCDSDEDDQQLPRSLSRIEAFQASLPDSHLISSPSSATSLTLAGKRIQSSSITHNGSKELPSERRQPSSMGDCGSRDTTCVHPQSPSTSRSGLVEPSFSILPTWVLSSGPGELEGPRNSSPSFYRDSEGYPKEQPPPYKLNDDS